MSPCSRFYADPEPPLDPTRASGVTLMECLAAVVILGTSIVAGLSLLGMHEGLAQGGEEANQGLLLLEREVDRVLGESYDQVRTTGYEALEDAPDFDVRCDVSTYATNVKSVEVFIRWTRHNGVQREHSITVLRSEGI